MSTFIIFKYVHRFKHINSQNEKNLQGKDGAG